MERLGDVGIRGTATRPTHRRSYCHVSFRSCARSTVEVRSFGWSATDRAVSSSGRCQNLFSRGCDVSFGGAFDGNMALYQLIRIGGFNQRRFLCPANPDLRE